VKPGRYLVDDKGWIKYRTDFPIAREAKYLDVIDDEPKREAPRGFDAPQPELFRSIIEGILAGTLQWNLFIVGVLIAIALEFAGVRALPFAVGMYIPLSSTTPIFVGGLIRWVTDKLRGVSASEAETETSPGVLLASGFIAGGTLIGLVLAFFVFLPDAFNASLNLGLQFISEEYVKEEISSPKIVAVIMFAVLVAILGYIGLKKAPKAPL
jgi:hypothetical protein